MARELLWWLHMWLESRNSLYVSETAHCDCNRTWQHDVGIQLFLQALALLLLQFHRQLGYTDGVMLY
jgi:hypothetical protein